jgi:hypothetical protein
VYSSSTRLRGSTEARYATSARGRGASTWKYDQAKPKTTDASSSPASTASASTPPAGWRSARTSGQRAACGIA